MASITEILLTDIAHKKDFLRQEGTGGDIQTVSGIENFRQAMLRRWITVPGTLAHRPEYGAGLKLDQNTVPTLQKKQEMAQRIREQALRDPRTESVTKVLFEIDDLKPDLSTITVTIKPIGLEETQIEFLPFGTEIL